MDILDIAAATVAAFRINGNQLYNAVRYDENTNLVVLHHPNIKLTYKALASINREFETHCKYHNLKIFDGLPEVIITDEDRKLAAIYLDRVQQSSIMTTLRGHKVTPFMAKLVQLTTLSTFSVQQAYSSIGMMVYIPKIGYAIEKQNSARSAIMEKDHSKHLGVVGEKIVTKFTVITSIFLRTRGCYLVKGADENGNLIAFFSGKNWDAKARAKIKGRIKSHEAERDTGYDVTKLNYVKEI